MQPSPTTVGDAGSSPFPSRVNVSGVTGDVLDVDVTLSGIEHQWPDDLDVVLVAPDGTAATVMSDVGGDGQTPATGTTLIFDDDGSGPVPLDFSAAGTVRRTTTRIPTTWTSMAPTPPSPSWRLPRSTAPGSCTSTTTRATSTAASPPGHSASRWWTCR